MILVLGLVLISSSAFAATVIRNSKHDLSSSGGQSVRSSVDKLCEHCHAPHNARVAVPLWNRANPTGTFLLYTSSATLRTAGAAKSASIGAASISAQCLSCHAARPNHQGDVTTVVRDNTINAAIKADASYVAPATGLKSAGLGTDLTNDHPIGFSYATAITDRATVTGATPLQTQGYAESKGMKFFTTGGFANQMECSSCHMVHNPNNGYFLRIANTGSAVCRACHQN